MSLLLRTAAIRAMEQRAIADGAHLMERAGRAAANAARLMLASASHHPARVLVLAGPGNNGGDAFEAAVHLMQWGFDVHVCFASDAARLPPDAAAAHAKWRAAGGQCSTALPANLDVNLVVDGLFGIGLTRAIASPYSEWIAAINAAHLPVLALDVPSGLNADTGNIAGVCLQAARTLTFIADKPGLHTLNGPDCAGAVEVTALGLRDAALTTVHDSARNPAAMPAPEMLAHAAAPTPNVSGHLTSHADFATLLAPRLRNTHKGSFGTLGIIGGAPGMAGAALLAGRAALKLGAGKVWIGLLDERGPAVDLQQPELMLRRADELDLAQCSALAAGPGMGTGATARACLAAAIATPVPLLLDADALNLTGSDSALASAVMQRSAATLLTPHPQEAARLLGCSTAEVQADRVAAACALAQRFHACVVLKGAGSVIASSAPSLHCDWWINPTGNPGMASAGMGDVLSGIAGALLAQFSTSDAPVTVGTSHSISTTALQALVGAVFLHGAAADYLVAQGIGPTGLTASEVIDAARRLWSGWCAEASSADERMCGFGSLSHLRNETARVQQRVVDTFRVIEPADRT